MQIDEVKLNDFMGRMVGELGAAMNTALVLVGDELGLYTAMKEAGPLSSEELAEKTGTNERYIREWLSAQAAGDLVTYDPHSRKFTLPNEQASALADENSPAYMPGAFQIVGSVIKDTSKLVDAFRTGEGVGWDQHDHGLFQGTERFFRPGYNAHLISEWLPALDGVVEHLQRGARVADVGCGFGSSTRLMAKAFPNSVFAGFDYHTPSIEQARRAAASEGLTNITFETATAKGFQGSKFDLITCFDCLHDMGDPIGAAAHVRGMLRDDGAWMIVEPYANDKLEDNLNPVGRIFYAASTMICTPASRAQEVGLCLGAQSGEQRMREVVTQGGFTRFRRATETPFNLVYEARP